MFEDVNMDKKTRSNQPLNKGNGSDSKKSQDAISSKQVPRHSRRREPNGSVPKNEGRGKPLLQKSKAFDKRPTPRGGFLGGKEDSKISLYEDELELESFYPRGMSKKIALNHLLNFQYGGTGERSSFTSRVHSRDARFNSTVKVGGAWSPYSLSSSAGHRHKYNKEQFVQANCQFVVRQDEDYSIHLGDPDSLVSWDLVEQIRGFGTEHIKCPICLDIPTAAQMTRCGHCFCWPCILHYLALSDKSWRKCPICYESVHLKDLKSYASVIRTACNVNETITFQLMKRERGSTLLRPVAQDEFHAPASLLSVSETQVDTVYAKLLTGSKKDVLNIVNAEEAQLLVLLDELGKEQCPTLCFTERALDLLRKRKADILAKIDEMRPGCSSSSPTTSCSEDSPSPRGGERSEFVELHPSSSVSLKDKQRDHQQPPAAKQQGEANHLSIGATGGEVLLEYAATPASGGALDKGSDEKEVLVEKVDIGKEEDGNGKREEWGGNRISSLCAPPSSSMVKVAPEDDSIPISDENRRRYESVSSEDGGVHQLNTTITADDLYIASPSQHATNQPNKYFYFYQAMDGQQIFLHAVNVRMLEMTYGSLEHCPHVIKGRVLEKEAGTMTEELRKRLRYLQHLPVTCQFEVAEIELRMPLISQDTVDRFKDQLASRERRRMKRAHEEQRRAKRIAQVECKQYGHSSYASSYAPHLFIESHFQFPECGLSPFSAPGHAGGGGGLRSGESCRASSPCSISSSSSVVGAGAATGMGGSYFSSRRRNHSPVTSALQALSLDSSGGSSSFAQKLREGTGVTNNGILWPSVGDRRRTVSDDLAGNGEHSSFSSSVPHYRQSFGQALTQSHGQHFATEDNNVVNGTKSNNKKNKKRKQTLLFTTGGRVCN